MILTVLSILAWCLVAYLIIGMATTIGLAISKHIKLSLQDITFTTILWPWCLATIAMAWLFTKIGMWFMKKVFGQGKDKT